MKSKRITVADWMGECGIPYVIDAEKYVLGQELSESDVEEIKKCLWFSIACGAGMGDAYHMVQFIEGYYRDEFHYFFMSLVCDPRIPKDSNWSDMLWNSVKPWDRRICHRFVHNQKK